MTPSRLLEENIGLNAFDIRKGGRVMLEYTGIRAITVTM
jgi:hypothetical protein